MRPRERLLRRLPEFESSRDGRNADGCVYEVASSSCPQTNTQPTNTTPQRSHTLKGDTTVVTRNITVINQVQHRDQRQIMIGQNKHAFEYYSRRIVIVSVYTRQLGVKNKQTTKTPDDRYTKRKKHTKKEKKQTKKQNTHTHTRTHTHTHTGLGATRRSYHSNTPIGISSTRRRTLR
jgi:hypothetical protein